MFIILNSTSNVEKLPGTRFRGILCSTFIKLIKIETYYVMSSHGNRTVFTFSYNMQMSFSKVILQIY